MFVRFAMLIALVSILVASSGLAARPAEAVEPIYTGLFSDLAVGGYDPVAYFEAGSPTVGSEALQTKWKGATWRFASAAHREAFMADPERYAPQYGGYCAWAVAQDEEASGDPLVWKIVDGKLYLNYSRSVEEKWSVDIPGFITKANANWPAFLAR